MARSRFHRSSDALPPLRLTARDDAILRHVERLGPCLVEHLRRLHFPSYKTAAERTMKLFQHRFLERRPLPAQTGQPAMAHLLGPRGCARLVELGLAPRVIDPADPRALAWSVARADVLTRFVVAARHPGIELPVVEADPEGPGLTPHALLVLDVPARLFRRILLLDFVPPDGHGQPKDRLDAWRNWATRPPPVIEDELQGLLDARHIARTHHRARVSIGVMVPDRAALDPLAEAAVDAGCGGLVYLATADRLGTATPLDGIWVRAADRARLGDAAPQTSVLA